MGIFAWLVALVLLGRAPIVGAQSVEQIKAAFLFNFARYVEWPDAAFGASGAAVRICMVGSPDFARVVSKTVSGKSVAISVPGVVAAPLPG